MTSVIEFEERDGGVVWCTLNGGARANAINPSMLAGLTEILDYVALNAHVVAVVVSAGSAQHFCAGGDLHFLARLTKSEAQHFADRVFEVCQRIERSPALWCAMLKGAVLGGGAELALAFDIRFAHRDTRLSFSQLKMGLTSGWGGFHRLVEEVGRSTALHWVLEATVLDADALSNSGIVTGLLADSEQDVFEAWRGDWCTEEANVLRGAIEVIKRSADRGQERAVFENLWQDAAHRRGLGAFLTRD